MTTYEEALTAAKANVVLGAVADAMALDGEDSLAVEEVALVFTAVTPTRDLIGVLSFGGARESLSDLTTLGLLQAGSNAMLQLSPVRRADEEDDES